MIFTQPSFWKELDFSGTGQIGDTIGGITAPFIGLISVWLLWRTLCEQINFNKEQAKDNVINRIISIMNSIFEIENRFNYELTKESTAIHEKIDCVSSLNKFSSTNEKFSLEYLTARELINNLDLIVLLCEQVIKLNTLLNKDIFSSYEDFAHKYLSSIQKFYKNFNNIDLIASASDSLEIIADDKTGKSETNKLRDDVKNSLDKVKRILMS